MAISLTIHQIGTNKNKENLIKAEEISIGVKIELKKMNGLLDDYMIGAYIGDKILGYILEIQKYLIPDTQDLNKELYEKLPDYFDGILEKKMFRTGINDEPQSYTMFAVKINNFEV